MKSDRARTDVGRISSFGLMEIVRQRLGSSAISLSTEACPCCNGTGIRRTMEWQALSALKDIHRLMRKTDCSEISTYACHQELALYLLNHKRDMLEQLSERCGRTVQIAIEPSICGH
jgi:ribonuclease E